MFEKKIGTVIKKSTKKLRAKFKKMTNVKKMMKTLFKTIMSKIKGIFSLKPSSEKDYFRLGKTYIAKKLLFIILIVILIVLFVFNRFIYPWAEGRFWTPEIVINSGKFYTYSGQARILDKDERVLYVGRLDKGKLTGEANLYDPSTGDLVYRGGFLSAQYSGMGERFTEEGVLVYRGMFANNTYNGEGQLFINGQLLYEGQFKDGLYQGPGQLYHNNGNLWLTGSFAVGGLNGEGKEYNSEGQLVYNGFFLDGLYDGHGTQYNPVTAQVIYEGQFRQDRYHGTGKLYDLELGRIIYEGEMVEGLYHGTGVLHNWKGQNVYEGHFYKGEIDYYRYIDTDVSFVRKEFGDESDVYFYEHHFVMDYRNLSMMFALQDAFESAPIVDRILFLGEQDFLGGPIGTPMPRLKHRFGQYESAHEFLITDEQLMILQRLRVNINQDYLYSELYLLNDDAFVRFFAADPNSSVLYFEMGGL